MLKILSTSGLKNVQDSQFQGPKMFKILTFRIQECSRFSVSAWKKNVWTKFCVSGKNLDVQKSEFQGRNFCWDLKVSSNGKSSVQVACMWGKSLLLARQLGIKQLRFSLPRIFNWRNFKLKIGQLSGFQGFQSPEMRGKKKL